MRSKPPGAGEPARVSAFCEREHEFWRIHVHPQGLPEYLDGAFDEHGEAFPVLLDFEDLAQRLGALASQCEKRETRLGSVELTAVGDAAETVAEWLLGSLASGFRPSSG